MPDTTDTPTMMHYRPAGAHTTACGLYEDITRMDTEPGAVTCFLCRKTLTFQLDQQEGVGGSTPPVRLSGVMAAAPELQTLHRAGLAYIVKRGLNSGTNDGEHEALTELADALGLVYDDDTESYT